MNFASFEGAEDIAIAWARGLAPDPAQTVAEWADRHRILSSRAASEAGPYRTSRTPYLKAIMEALSPNNPAQRVVFMKSAQVGATEAGNNWIGFCIHRAPGPILAVQPTTDLAKRLSQQRIEPLIEESPDLRALVLPARSRDAGNTVLAKRFPGGQLVLTGANSAVGLRSMPARWLFLDEVDAYPGDLEGEGDPVALAEARTDSFGHRKKIFLASTPTIKGLSRIEREFELTDQRRYHVPCPHCGGLQWLKFERLRWEKGRPETAAYLCEHCEVPIAERHKTWMMDEENGADWLPTAAPDVQASAETAGVIGFHISGLYSPLGWLSWEEIARRWDQAQGNDSALKTVKNTVLGETWAERGEAPDWQRLYERREDWQLGRAPGGVLILTAGIDVQRDRIEIDVWGWGRNLRSWLVDHVVLEGDTARAEVWADLNEFLGMTWEHASGARMALARVAIDSGDGATTDAVYAWARQAGHGQVIAIKGVAGFDRSTPVDGPTYVETTEGGRKLRRGVRLWKVAGAVFKAETYRFLRLAAPTDEERAAGADWPAGFVHIPDHPGDAMPVFGRRFESLRVGAEGVAHLFERQRVQNRGVPWGVPAMRALRELGDWQTAELVRKKIEASMVGFVFGADEDQQSMAPVVQDADGNRIEQFEPGLIGYVRNGKDIKFNTPASTSGIYEWNRVQQHIISAGFRVPYELMTGDLSQVNFASSRVGLHEFRRMVEAVQWQVVIPMFCQRIWDWVMEAAWTAGALPQPEIAVEWAPPRFESVNPLQDVTADLMEVRAGFSTPAQQIARRGYDPREVVEEWQKYAVLFDQLGLIFDADPRRVSRAGLAQAVDPTGSSPPPDER